MTFVNPEYFKNKPLIEAIKDFIWDSKKSYYELDDVDKAKLAGLCMQGQDRFSRSDCIIQTDGFDKFENQFEKFLLTSDKDESIEMIETLRKSAIEYYEETLDSLFDELYSIQLSEEGMIFERSSNGDSYWLNPSTGERLYG